MNADSAGDARSVTADARAGELRRPMTEIICAADDGTQANRTGNASKNRC
jgi:hypothetical protein